MDHAWVEQADGSIFDPVLDATFTLEIWKWFANPVERIRYTETEVMTVSLGTGHWGPWEDDDEEKEA